MNATLNQWQRFINYFWKRPISEETLLTILRNGSVFVRVGARSYWPYQLRHIVKQRGPHRMPCEITIGATNTEICFPCEIDADFVEVDERSERKPKFIVTLRDIEIGTGEHNAIKWKQEVTPELERIICEAIEKQD